MKRIPLILTFAVIALIASTSLGWASSTGVGTVSVGRLKVETPYISGCCAYLEDSRETVEFDLYKSSAATQNSSPVVITLQRPGESQEVLTNLNIELARRNLTVISINIPSSINYTLMRMKARQLGDVMAFVRETIRGIERNYAVIASSASVGIAFSMNYLITQPSAIVSLGYPENFEREAKYYEGNLLQLLKQDESSEKISEAGEILSTRTEVSDPDFGSTYGNLQNLTASKVELLPSGIEYQFNNEQVITESIDWIMKTLFSEDQIIHTLPPEETLLTQISVIYLVSEILLGVGFLLGVVAIVEYRKCMHEC